MRRDMAPCLLYFVRCASVPAFLSQWESLEAPRGSSSLEEGISSVSAEGRDALCSRHSHLSVCFLKKPDFLWAVTVYSGCDKPSSLSCLGSCDFSKVIFRVKRECVDRSTWCTKCSVKCCFCICVHLHGNTRLKSGPSLFIWFLSK